MVAQRCPPAGGFLCDLSSRRAAEEGSPRRPPTSALLLARALKGAPRDLRPTHRHENRDLRHPDGRRGEAAPRPYSGFPPFGKLRAGFARE
jgi:hypothetical protein